MLANLVVDLLVSQVGLGAQPCRFQPLHELDRIGIGIGNDGRHHRLNRRQPEGQSARIVFEQNP